MCVYRDELEIPYTSRDFPHGSRRASLEFVCVFGQKAHEYFDLTRTAALQTK